MLSRNELNFSGGPGALPQQVLRELQEAIIALPDVGVSVLGISHRSDWFAQMVRCAEDDVRILLGLDASAHVMFLQGGATQQFSMLPMAFLRGTGKAADYINSGYWSAKAIPEAKREGAVRVVWDGATTGYATLPDDAALDLAPDAAYLHYASNETVEGLQFNRVLGRDDVLRICDMSSDFLSCPVDASRFGVIYAHAQKNIGPAGVTVVVMQDAVLAQARADVPGFLSYPVQAAAHSNYNTPPVFAIYAVWRVLRWLRDTVGGLSAMAAINHAKATALYQCLDASDGFYTPRVQQAGARSSMNVAFRLPSLALEQAFLAEAERAGLSGLAGHRSVGGLRASLYNGLSRAAVAELCNFIDAFCRKNSHRRPAAALRAEG